MTYTSLVAVHLYSGFAMIVFLVVWMIWILMHHRGAIELGASVGATSLSSDNNFAEEGDSGGSQNNGFLWVFLVIILIVISTGVFLYGATNPKVIFSAEAIVRWRTGYYILWHGLSALIGIVIMLFLILGQRNIRWQLLWRQGNRWGSFGWFLLTIILLLSCFLPCFSSLV